MSKRATTMPRNLDQAEEEYLFEVGFTKWEIKKFNENARSIDLNSEVWRTAIGTRMTTVATDSAGFHLMWDRFPTRAEMDRIVHNWYHEHLINDPWVWIQLAYKAKKAKVNWERYVDKAHARAVRVTRDLRAGDISELVDGIKPPKFILDDDEDKPKKKRKKFNLKFDLGDN